MATSQNDTTINEEEGIKPVSANMDFSEAQQVICSVIPPLNPTFHKGQAGRVAIIGGSTEFTGATYFAAMTSLRTGCDLSYVICSSDSAPIIKSYSPELIVFPILDQTNALDEIVKSHLPKFHSIVIGPGLGRNERTFSTVGSLISTLKDRETPVVLDADILFFISKCPEIVRGYTKAILTPNVVEFDRLYSSVFRTESQPIGDDPKTAVEELARTLGHITILRKGSQDIISNGHHTFVGDEIGSPRRCGGQGDILAGSIGTFSHWSHNAFRDHSTISSPIYQRYSPTIIAALAGSMLTKRCARQQTTNITDLFVGRWHFGGVQYN
ncbi:hypothetical protein BLOT_005166 [Blomia tropicalis]|nr:hypothetical protein BLOT_005166 [Blomia tropicalis]